MIKTMETLARRVVNALRWLFTPMALLFLFIAGYKFRHDVVAAFHNANPIFLACTVLLCMLLHPLTAMFSRLALLSHGKSIPYPTLLYIQLHRLPARYLPGGVWQTASRMMDLHHRGIERKQLTALVLMENVIPLSIALMLSGPLLYTTDRKLAIPACAVFTGAAAMLSVYFFLKKILSKENFLSKWPFIGAIGVSLFFWTVSSLAFFLYWHAFPTPLAQKSFPMLASTYLLAWCAGFVAIFAPQGIGVFESTGGFLLHREIPIEYAAAIFAGFRIATLTGDFLMFTFFTLTRISHNKVFRNKPN
jgi:hypothetical protein